MSEEPECDDFGLDDLKKTPVPKDYKTFDEWRKWDRSPAKGEKAEFFNGTAYFHRNQTVTRDSGFSYGDPSDQYDEHEMDSWAYGIDPADMY